MASEDYATEAQIKRLYAVLHSVGLDPKQWKKDANIASYAKLTRAQCSAYIDEAEAFEAEQKKTGSYHPGVTGDAATDEEAEQQRKDRLAAEIQKIREEQGRGAPGEKPDDVPPQGKPKEAPPTVEELIFKYLDIMVKVTVAVEENKQISERQRGYTVNWVCDAVKDALNGKGGNQEEA